MAYVGSSFTFALALFSVLCDAAQAEFPGEDYVLAYRIAVPAVLVTCVVVVYCAYFWTRRRLRRRAKACVSACHAVDIVSNPTSPCDVCRLYPQACGGKWYHCRECNVYSCTPCTSPAARTRALDSALTACNLRTLLGSSSRSSAQKQIKKHQSRDAVATADSAQDAHVMEADVEVATEGQPQRAWCVPVELLVPRCEGFAQSKPDADAEAPDSSYETHAQSDVDVEFEVWELPYEPHPQSASQANFEAFEPHLQPNEQHHVELNLQTLDPPCDLDEPTKLDFDVVVLDIASGLDVHDRWEVHLDLLDPSCAPSEHSVPEVDVGVLDHACDREAMPAMEFTAEELGPPHEPDAQSKSETAMKVRAPPCEPGAQNKPLEINGVEHSLSTNIAGSRFLAAIDDTSFKVNGQDGRGNTALHFAIFHGDKSVARALLSRGASVNKANNVGDTPLHVAARRNRLALAKILVEAGADRIQENGAGQTPFRLAEKGSGIAAYLTPKRWFRFW